MTSPKVESERPPKVGDRVRVVIEGEALPTTLGRFWIGEQRNLIDPLAAHVVSVEVLPPPEPPEPQWQWGDIVTDSTGSIWKFYADAFALVWAASGTRSWSMHDADAQPPGAAGSQTWVKPENMRRPLTLHLRDGGIVPDPA